MEPHPVPQNFLSTEFKLFGAFTLKQFVRILIGVLVAIGIFVININLLIKIPLILAAIGIGVMTAIIPGFEKWVFGYIKAIFVSPRYVWQKQSVSTDTLFSPMVKSDTKDESLESALDKKMIDIDKLPLEKLFGSPKVVDPVTETVDTLDAPKENVNAIYEDVFGKEVINTQRNVPVYETVTNEKVNVAQKKSMGSRPEGRKFNTIEEYKREIERLKYELSKFSGKDPVSERRITEEINELFMEVKLIMNDNQFKNNAPVQNKLEKMATAGKMIVGIVVSKKDVPVPNAIIDFISTDRVVARVSTSQEGKFTLSSPIPLGTYDVRITHPSLRFHSYKIVIAEGNPTGFKFREK